MNQKDPLPSLRRSKRVYALLLGVSFLLAIGAAFPGIAWMQSGNKEKQKKAETGGRNPKRAVSGRAGKPGAAVPAKPQFDPYAPEIQADGSMIGKPATGEKGISETVGDLMAREAKIAPFRSTAPRRSIEREVERENLPSAPGAPAVASWPPSDKTDDTQTDGTKKGVLNTGVVTPNAPQTVSTPNFTGATLTDTSAFPPDTMGAVGPTQFIVALNGRIRSFNKTTGAADGVLNVDTDVFFNSVMTPPTSSNFTTDPRIRYDRLSGRWIIIIIDVPGSAGALANRVLIAVSSGSTITAASNFTFFQYQISTTLFADYPTLGIDNNALYIGANMFTLAGAFDSTAGTVIRKSSILGAGPIVFTNFPGLVPTSSSAGPFTPQGVDNFDPAATEGYFIGVDNAVFSQLDIRRVSNPGATPTLSGNLTITVPTTNFSQTVTHLGNTGGANGNLDGLDDRLYAAHFRDGRLWTAHNIRVNASGVASATQARNAVRWYELQNLTTTPILRQSGTIFDNASTTAAAQQYWIPSVMVSGQGHAAFGFSAAGTNFRIDGATVGRLAGDTLGTTQGAPVRYTASSTAYNPPSDTGVGNGSRRWGDYSYTSLDPLDDMTMWTIQEFCDSTNSYGVRIVRLLSPPPATPASASPSSVTTGTTTSVTITGTSVSGSGFYDPPATLTGRIPISASVSGTGVTVNSVTFNSATSVTLNLTVAGGAATGTRDVTVTNPDGQSVTGTGILAIAPPACSTPTVINSSLSFSSTGGFQASTCSANGYTNDYVLNATITNTSSQTLCSLSSQVVALNESGGPTPAVPFRLTSADGATCTSGGLTGSVQSIPGTLAPGQSANVTFRIAVPSLRRFVFLINVFGGNTGSSSTSLKAAANAQKAFEVQIDGATPVQPAGPTTRPKAKRND